jgi:hypothetical protein
MRVYLNFVLTKFFKRIQMARNGGGFGLMAMEWLIYAICIIYCGVMKS